MADVVWKGDQAQKKILDACQEALWMVGQETIRLATPEVPLDTGTLRRSGTVTADKLPDPEEVFDRARSGSGTSVPSGKAHVRKTKDLTVFVSYNTPYATHLHEDMAWSPRGPNPVGGPKWLEKALPEAWARLAEFVRRARKKQGL